MKSSRSPKPKLLIDWCSHKAAKFACENWHYSKCVPAGKLAKLGVWENDKFIGVVTFGRGAAPKLASSWGCDQTEVYELVRIALKNHRTPVSRLISISLRLIKTKFPKVKAIISFADPRQDHLGIVYQASNWIFYGLSGQTGGHEYYINNKWFTARSIGAKYGTRETAKLIKLTNNAPKRRIQPKRRYIFPFDKQILIKANKIRKPYPKRHKQSIVASAIPGGRGRCDSDRGAPKQKDDRITHG